MNVGSVYNVVHRSWDSERERANVRVCACARIGCHLSQHEICIGSACGDFEHRGSSLPQIMIHKTFVYETSQQKVALSFIAEL
jgi:hypothetical protein